MYRILVLALLCLPTTLLHARSSSYTELLDYVQVAPDQGETNACLFIASTGAMELIANKVNGIKNPKAYGPYDLAESYTMYAGDRTDVSFLEAPVLALSGSGIQIKHWPFEAWNGSDINQNVWNEHPNLPNLPRIKLPQVETIKLFQIGNRYSTNVLDETHIEQIKQALLTHRSPVLINYNDENFWHVILIVGFDDKVPGECYDTDPSECSKDIGSFYIRDSFGVKIEARDYDWFRVKGNAAFVVKAKK